MAVPEEKLSSKESENHYFPFWHSRFRRFVLLLLMLVAISSSIIGYIIGRIVHIDYYTGQIIDTITIEFAKNPKPITPGQIDPLPLPTDPTKPPEVTVSDDYDSSDRMWQKTTSIDIFGERAGNYAVQTIHGEIVIAPGSHGRFIFKIKNPHDYSVELTIDLKDSDANIPNIPMIYRLKRGVSGDNFVGGNAWREASTIVEIITMSANSESYYTLEWEWDGSNNLVDTAIGNQEILPAYILDIIVTAE